jgi:hypothetical protein
LAFGQLGSDRSFVLTASGYAMGKYERKLN